MTRSQLVLISAALAALACDPPARRSDAGMIAIDAGRRDASVGIDASTPGGPVGASCVQPSDCESGICFPTGFGDLRCSAPCDSAADCPESWSCEDFAGTPTCTCAASPERCNGVDDDCDAVIDEGSAEAIGCALGELCAAGACSCPGDRRCDVGCTDLETDRLHCGACGNACPGTQRCVGGACCTPAVETCDGTDQDCDGAVDEDGAGCGPGQVCTGESCVCPSASTCGGACVDLERDPAHCGACGRTCEGSSCVGGECCELVGSRVDMLFMVDNSNSMAEEQASLAAQIPRIVRALATGDVDGDGTPESVPVADLHLGVITSDMGVGGAAVPTCVRGDFGDDGVLRTQGNTSNPSCMATYPSFLQFRPSDPGADPDAVATELACVATSGIGGCGFEQQLEAVLKATTPSTSPLRFFSDTRGHADVANAGFLRDDSILVTLLLTDENDCSASDPDIFDPESTTYGGSDLNLRCFTFPSALHPLTRFVDGLLATRSDARDLIFAAITGVPTELVTAGVPPDYARILGDPQMAERVDPAMPNRLVPSCNVPGRGIAFPPRRIVRVAEGLDARGATSVVGSICQEDYSGPVSDILDQITQRLGETCITRP